MCNACKSIDGGLPQRAVYKEAVVVADEGEGYHTDRLEDTGSNDEGATKLTLGLGRYAEGLRDYGHDDDGHAN